MTDHRKEWNWRLVAVLSPVVAVVGAMIGSYAQQRVNVEAIRYLRESFQQFRVEYTEDRREVREDIRDLRRQLGLPPAANDTNAPQQESHG